MGSASKGKIVFKRRCKTTTPTTKPSPPSIWDAIHLNDNYQLTKAFNWSKNSAELKLQEIELFYVSRCDEETIRQIEKPFLKFDKSK